MHIINLPRNTPEERIRKPNLDEKEICYLRTVIVTANVCHSSLELRNTGHISVLKYRHLSLNLVYLLYSRSIYNVVIPKLDK